MLIFLPYCNRMWLCRIAGH